jgi:hypothetical protein
MAVKLVVMYRRPQDFDPSEQVYNHQRVPMAIDKLAKPKIGSTKPYG